MVKCLPEFELFYCILGNRNFISKIRISKVTDYAAFNYPFVSIFVLLISMWLKIKSSTSLYRVYFSDSRKR